MRRNEKERKEEIRQGRKKKKEKIRFILRLLNPLTPSGYYTYHPL
jgi:hypothetical protein